MLAWVARVAKVSKHKVSDHSNLKILSQNLLNEIRKMIYSLYWAKEITKKYTTI